MIRANSDELIRLSQLIGLIYDGATDPSRWSSSILPALCEYLKMHRVVIFTPLQTLQMGGYLFSHGYNHGYMEIYINK